VIFSDRFSEALVFALGLHNDQVRKGTKTPYMAHLLAVTAIVLENGGDEDQAIGALLHDAAEDRGGGVKTLFEIQKRFGERVSRIVQACSDSVLEEGQEKTAWQPRKEIYLKFIQEKPADAILVSLADKIHNSRAILSDYREIGETLWQRFKGGRDGTLWYYRALFEAFKPVGPERMVNELKRTIEELEKLAKQ